MERVKQELSRAQKLNSEQTSQFDKLKKQNDSFDTKLQESRKQNLVDQGEIKELRAKLRVSENERGHLALKSEEGGDARKSIAALEVKRKEELRERDRHIAELEKSVATEQKRNLALEGKLLEARGRTQQELDEARKTISSLRSKVAVAEEDVASARTGAGQREEELITQLESARNMIQRVAEEYGRLASSTVPKASYDAVKRENCTLRLNVTKLQRKFTIADSEVHEMVDLLKVSRDQCRALEHILRGVRADLDSQADVLSEAFLMVDDTPPNEYAELESRLLAVALDESTRRVDTIAAQLSSTELFTDWYKALGRTLLHDYSLACTELSAAAEENQVHQNATTVATTHVSTLSTQLEAAKLQTDSIQRQAAELSERLEVAKAREASLKGEATKRERDVKTEKQAAKERLEREKEMVNHLQTSMERQRFAEDEMRSEISTYATTHLALTAADTDVFRLSRALAESEDYAHAYRTLVDEVNALVDRNALAEEEAQQLSKFNAELLSHKNPAQKIMYVDRIRQELADAKQVSNTRLGVDLNPDRCVL